MESLFSPTGKILIIVALFTNVLYLEAFEPIFVKECVKPVDEHFYPKCTIELRRQELARPRAQQNVNATCREDNVFVVSNVKTAGLEQNGFATPNNDSSEPVPPWIIIICNSTFPIVFDYEGLGGSDCFYVETFRLSNTSFQINTQVILSPEATGKYVFYARENRSIQTSFFVFSERGSKPYLIGGTSTMPAIKLNSTAVAVPCISSDLAANVNLFKKTDNVTWTKINSTETEPLPYDRQKGFIMNSPEPGDYRCYCDEDDPSTSTDFVTVRVENEENTALIPEKDEIEIGIVDGMAVCYSKEKSEDMKLWNIYTQSISQNRYFHNCYKRSFINCGTHYYHQKGDGRILSTKECPHNSSTCLWADVGVAFKTGLLICSTKDHSNLITLNYILDLDNKIQTTSWLNLLDSQMIRVSLTPNSTMNTITYYGIKCEFVQMLIFNPVTVSVKYKNGSINELEPYYGWRSYSIYLTLDMDELMCSGYSQISDRQFNATMKLNVTENQCESTQFTCKNRQCIRGTYQCDGDRDCNDGSDELNCTNIRCKYSEWKCNSTGTCIAEYRKCNNVKDCQDGEDESLETCLNKYCDSTQVKCKSGQCISTSLLCNGIVNCYDKSDEDADHCAKYHPRFKSAKTRVTFTQNSVNELICSLEDLPTTHKATLSWWRRAQAISDHEMLWQDASGARLALRFENVTENDNGEYICVANNTLARKVLVYTVTVNKAQPETTTKAAKPTIVEPEKTIAIAATGSESNQAGESTSFGLTIGLILAVIAVAVIVVIAGGLVWRRYKRRPVRVPSARIIDNRVYARTIF